MDIVLVIPLKEDEMSEIMGTTVPEVKTGKLGKTPKRMKYTKCKQPTKKAKNSHGLDDNHSFGMHQVDGSSIHDKTYFTGNLRYV